jgi:hypothetical protein
MKNGTTMGVPINRLESIWPQAKTADAGLSPASIVGGEPTWSDSAKGLEANFETVLAKHPKLAIAAAAAAGLLLGWLVKRK